MLLQNITPLLLLLLSPSLHALSVQKKISTGITRATFLKNVGSVLTVTTVASQLPPLAVAATAVPIQPKRTNISDDELKKIITSDMVERSFLVSADLTRDIYDERSVFTDEIDSYPIEKWITGTKRLFVPSGSRVSLVGDVDVTRERVEFRFDEDLMFNIPLLRPVVSLTGKVLLDRDLETGLITSYREFWDQDVNSVLKTATFGKK